MEKAQRELLQDLTVLYVEDDEDTREALDELLRLWFKEVYIASDGVEGLELYRSKKPQIVLSDIAMPRMNGIEMCKKIKEMEPNQPMAFFTAFNERRDVELAAAMGITDYIVKPMYNKQLFDALASMAKAVRRSGV